MQPEPPLRVYQPAVNILDEPQKGLQSTHYNYRLLCGCPLLPAREHKTRRPNQQLQKQSIFLLIAA
jgi:hypothetical protein